ncbi:MAG: hypothetical protein QOF70_6660, partial [Acetobacteraceae bacterium]|nr:hypothetical protein [Acetobacteraceae bacterium]
MSGMTTPVLASRVLATSVLATGWTVAATLLAPALRLNLRRRAVTGREIAARLPERRGIDPTPRPAGP